MNRKGFELAINFLILTILALVVFGYSVQFLYSIYGSLSELEQKNFDQLDSEIHELQCGNQKVCPAIIRAGKMETKQIKTFAFKILNVKKTPANFKVQMTQEVAPPGGHDLFFTYKNTPRTFQLGPNEGKTIAIGVEIPKDAIPGNYVLNIKVFSISPTVPLYGEQPYGTSRGVYKVHVEVI